MTRDDVLAAQRGDPRAFGRLVRDHAAAVLAITTAITGSAGVGEEVGQEVFVCAWRQLAELREPERFGAWVRGIARNRARDVARSAARREIPTDRWELPDPTAADPGERLDADRAAAAVWSALDALDDDDHREVLVLYYREGRSLDQVARLLELPEPTVRKRLSRAREHLRGDVEHRLGSELTRTAPRAAAVAAAVLAAVAPPARAAVGWVVAVAFGVGLGVVGWLAVPRELAARSAPVSRVTAAVARSVVPSLPPDLTPDPASAPLPPLQVQRAFLAAEDARFRSHGAVDWAAIGRAAAATATGDRQGGSTVTQQLAKRLIAADWPEPTIGRKLGEVWVAAELERRWSKDEILAAYLGSVYLGHGAVGVDAAAQVYFGVSSDALTLGQAALLAGLPAAPVANDPIDAPDRARERQRQVLDAMARLGWATADEVQAALAEPLP